MFFLYLGWRQGAVRVSYEESPPHPVTTHSSTVVRLPWHSWPETPGQRGTHSLDSSTLSSHCELPCYGVHPNRIGYPRLWLHEILMSAYSEKESGTPRVIWLSEAKPGGQRKVGLALCSGVELRGAGSDSSVVAGVSSSASSCTEGETSLEKLAQIHIGRMLGLHLLKQSRVFGRLPLLTFSPYTS